MIKTPKSNAEETASNEKTVPQKMKKMPSGEMSDITKSVEPSKMYEIEDIYDMPGENLLGLENEQKIPLEDMSVDNDDVLGQEMMKSGDMEEMSMKLIMESAEFLDMPGAVMMESEKKDEMPLGKMSFTEHNDDVPVVEITGSWKLIFSMASSKHL